MDNALSQRSRWLCACLALTLVATACGRLESKTAVAQEASGSEPKLVSGVAPDDTWPQTNPFLADSPWPQQHRSGGTQSSTWIAGPVDDNVDITVIDYAEDTGEDRTGRFGRAVSQVSPWLAVGPPKYVDDPNARALWSVSFTDVYKYAIQGDQTRYVDHQQIRQDPASVSWNFLVLDDGRVVVPNPLGTRIADRPCRNSGPALLVFEDGPTLDSAIRCTQHLRADEAMISSCLGPDGRRLGPRADVGYSLSLTGLTYTGELIVGIRILEGDETHTYLAVATNDLRSFIECRFASAADVTNAPAIEPIDADRSAIYLATAESLVAIVWDQGSQELERTWEQDLLLRLRTGTTPTMVGFGEDRFLAVVDAPCAVTNVFTGRIRCERPATEPARILAVARDPFRAPAQVHEVALPAEFQVVENSPSARGMRLVVAAYGGYEPTASVRGVASAVYDQNRKRFTLDWSNPNVQMNGITTISDGAGLIYSTGVADDGLVHLYGLDLEDGSVVIDVPVIGGRIEAVFDQGNNTIVVDDGSLLWGTEDGFVRIRPR